MNDDPLAGTWASDFRDALASNDRRKALEAMRDQLAWKMDAGTCTHCGGPKGETAGMASVAKCLLTVLDELEKIPTEQEVSKIDELAGRRRDRWGSETKDSALSYDPGLDPKQQQRRQGGRRPGGGRRAES